MNKDRISKSVDNIKREADNIDDEVRDKSAKTYGDPECEISY